MTTSSQRLLIQPTRTSGSRHARELYLAHGDHFSENQVKVALARLLVFSGTFAEAISLQEATLPLYHEMGKLQQVASFTVRIAFSEMLLARHEEARS